MCVCVCVCVCVYIYIYIYIYIYKFIYIYIHIHIHTYIYIYIYIHIHIHTYIHIYIYIYIYIYIHTHSDIQGFSAVTTHVKKYDIFSRVFDIANKLLTKCKMKNKDIFYLPYFSLGSLGTHSFWQPLKQHFWSSGHPLSL